MQSVPALGLLWVFSRKSRRRLALSIFLSTILAFAEIVAFSAVVPLAQILSGIDMADSRTLQTVGRIFNTDSDEQLVGWVCASMLVLFLIKGICGLLVRWWILGFIYREEANLAEELVSFYAHETLEFHLANRSSELLRNLNDAVSQVFVFGVVGFVGFLGELTFTICVGAVLIALAPVPMGAFVTYVGLATWVILAIIRPRARETGRQMTASSAHI